ncbi:MAG: hypothetical protein LBP73_02970 [Clostridiales Family XIII bacterium]|jgi:hypothetical protein|nr:hypothetical protein [Clostridiales Family XIII bacterium]
MGLLLETVKDHRVVSVVGMAKNTGKTTALGALIAEARDAGIRLGITSTGRDGESEDLVTGTAKPRIFLPEGAVATIPTELYAFADAGLEILRMTDYRTALGRVMLCGAVSEGYAQVAGPVSAEGQTGVCAEMLALGADMVLIDGAVDRRSVAAPRASDAVILATGAALSGRVSEVAAETAHVVGLYGLPVLRDAAALAEIAKHAGEKRILCLGDETKILDLRTGLAAGADIGGAIDENSRYICLPGALTRNMAEGIPANLLKNAAFVVADPTRIFVDRRAWRRLQGKGLRVFVLSGVKIAAITVNPYSPAGFFFDSEELLRSVGAAVGDIPVVDVRMRKFWQGKAD